MTQADQSAEKPAAQDGRAIDRGTRIGHVHLKVADLERAIAFYRGVLGFEITQRYGRQAAFLSAGGYHHHIGLNTWESTGGSPPPKGTTGLYHVAILYPTRAALAAPMPGTPVSSATDRPARSLSAGQVATIRRAA